MNPNESHWRNASRQVIAGVKEANPSADRAELKKLLFKAYPFGMRRYHPYKIWCEEVRIALGVKKKPAMKAWEIPEGQEVLF